MVCICTIISVWWLVKRHISGYLCLFVWKFSDCGGDLWIILCPPVSPLWVVSTLIGGENTNLNCYNSICLKFLHSQVMEMLKHCSQFRATSWNLYYLIFRWRVDSNVTSLSPKWIRDRTWRQRPRRRNRHVVVTFEPPLNHHRHLHDTSQSLFLFAQCEPNFTHVQPGRYKSMRKTSHTEYSSYSAAVHFWVYKALPV